MKKIIALALSLVLCLSVFSACATSGTPAGGNPETKYGTIEEGKLFMSTNAAFPPYEFTDDSGAYVGIDVEVAQAIADKLGLELVIYDMEFVAALEAAQSGKSDMVMAGVTVTDDRLTVMSFSDSYATGIQVVIVTEDSSIASIDDLEGKKIGTQMGTTGYIYCSDTPEKGGYGEENVIGYKNGITAVQALQNGVVDCVVIDKAPAEAFVQANPGLKILPTEFAVEDYAIGFAKGNTKLQKAVNEALAELIADGTVAAIVAKYIPAE